MKNDISFFLGTNSGTGFHSLFYDLTEHATPYSTFIIKGGPGTGKSGLMKKVAEECEKRGLFNEKLWCSSDPDSLDGVFIPEKHCSVCDGTAPHVVEPVFAGAAEQIVNVAALWNRKNLKKKSKEIIRLSNENGFCHKRVASLLCAATALKQNMSEIYKTALKKKKLHELTGDILLQFEPLSDKNGRIENRFLSGVTPKGLITFTNTVKNLADDITVIRDESGITEKLLADIADYSASIGYDVIVCRDVLFPEKTAHVLIPEKRLAYVTSCDAFPISIKGAKHISADKYCDKNILSKYDSELCFYKENIKTLLLKCVDILKEAKNIHDELEDCYISEMDFGALDRLTDDLIKEMLG